METPHRVRQMVDLRDSVILIEARIPLEYALRPDLTKVFSDYVKSILLHQPMVDYPQIVHVYRVIDEHPLEIFL